MEKNLTKIKSRTISWCFVLLLLLYIVMPATASAGFIKRESDTNMTPESIKELEYRLAVDDGFSKELEGIEAHGKQAAGSRKMQAVAHGVWSHISIITRPFTSFQRLLFMVVDTAADAFRWTWPNSFNDGEVAPLARHEGMDLVEWERELDEITGTTSSKGTIRYLIDGEEFFSRLIKRMSEAVESIHLRTYIFDNDEHATKIGEILKKRSHEVDTRVMLDGAGSIMATMGDSENMPADHKVPNSVRAFLKEGSKIRVRQRTNPFFFFDHSKTTILDRKIAFIGGMNIGREYRYEWHDMMMEVEGPVVDILQNDFNRAWAHAGFFGDFEKLIYRLKRKKKVADDLGYPIRVLFTRPGDSQIYRTQIAAIRNAKKFIFIQNAYFSDDKFLYELIRARRRGVDVRVILPDRENWNKSLKGSLKKMMNSSNALAANAMLANGIKVYLYPSMTHIKAAVYDGWACLGSANFDKASLHMNEEINIATSHPSAVNELVERLFLPDFEKSRELTREYKIAAIDRISELIADQL